MSSSDWFFAFKIDWEAALRICETYSHLGGLEFLLVHRTVLWKEIKAAIEQVNMGKCNTETSKGKTTDGKPLFSATELNMKFKRLLKQKGWTKISYNQPDFVKDRVAIEMQLGNYPFATYDLFAKQLAFYVCDQIDVGIEILPVKFLQYQISSGATRSKGKSSGVAGQGRGVPAVPLVIIGIEA